MRIIQEITQINRGEDTGRAAFGTTAISWQRMEFHCNYLVRVSSPISALVFSPPNQRHGKLRTHPLKNLYF